MQHGSVDHPSSHRLHKLGMGNAVKVAAEIRIHDLSMSGVDQLVDMLYCVQRTAVRPIGVLLRWQVGLENRFENQPRCTTRSRMVGIPNGLRFPSGLGIYT